MNKVFHLSSCETCQRIIKETGIKNTAFTFQDIKTENVSAADLDAWAAKVGSYEALFSRRALKFRAMGLHEQTLTEQDYRRLILEEYTFLKRPVIVVGDDIFVGNTAKVVAAAKIALNS